MFDPEICAGFLVRGDELLSAIDKEDPLPAVLEAEPKPVSLVSTERLDDCARAFADMIDLKTPFTHGHSVGVAELAAAAGKGFGLDDEEVTSLWRAGMLHDLGRVAVPDGIWEKRGPLSEGEWEQVRLHTYHSERILSRADALSAAGRIAGMHHERLDGSGYHRQSTGSALPMTARILAVADSYQAMTQTRPHRPALPHEVAASELESAVEAGELDAEAVRAVIEASGHESRRLVSQRPAGLSEREVEVLRLLAAGLSNREIANKLFISRRTAESHVQHIYTKIGFSTRAGAAMFAMQHDLIV
jgi:HD-GYP domain-containing protein (c-di-GMP phosphodiesterase class II)